MMTDMNRNDNLNRIFAIPNLLPYFRLMLIPVILWLYCFEEQYLWAAVVLILSAITDLLDGIIAQRFHMVSNLGKVLDPIASKLTQAALLFCLITSFPAMKIPLIVLIAKDSFIGILGALIIYETGIIYDTPWYEKTSTALIYPTIILHILWPGIPIFLSNSLVVLCTGMMLLSLLLYTARDFGILFKEL